MSRVLLMFDTSKRANQSQAPLYIVYWSPVTHKICVTLLDSKVTISGDSAVLSAAISAVLQQNNIPADKVFAIIGDNCSAIQGLKGGLITLFSQQTKGGCHASWLLAARHQHRL